MEKSSEKLNKVTPIREMVEKRSKEESSRLKRKDGGGGRGGGKITSRFIEECLYANEFGDGVLYAQLHKNKFLYNKSAGQWLEWAGHYWETDIMENAVAAVEAVALAYLREAKDIVDRINAASKKGQKDEVAKLAERQEVIYRRVSRLRSDRGRNNCIKFARTNPQNALAIKGEELDNKPWLLACKNGVIDLRTGELSPGRPEDCITKVSPIEWKGIGEPAVMWEKALLEIFSGNEETVNYIRRLFGYAINGTVKEHILPVLWGQGRNGKGSILIETISKIMGPMAEPIPAEMLLDQGRSRSSSGPSPDIMALRGLRLAFASETDEGRQFSPSKVKWLSGGDTLTGRAPHDRYSVTFKPSHKLFLLTNSKPYAPADDFAFWERLHLIPFEISFVDREPRGPNERRADKDLPDRLIDQEASGILAWLVRGCLEWQKTGLMPPDIVKEATEEYRRDEDILMDFIEQCCHVALEDPGVKESAANLYNSFSEWWKENMSNKVPSQKKFGRWMTKKRQFRREKKGTYVYYGLRVLSSI